MSIFSPFREHRPFPGQDPWVIAHGGELLLVQSSSGSGRIVVKRFRDLERMERNKETVVWVPNGPARHLRQVWAPELHEIDGRWFLYFTAADGRPGSHRAYALTAETPFGPYQWLGPVGDPAHDVWAIDLTVFRHAGRLYALWSGWEGAHDGFPQNLYIAPMTNPWTISGERRCLSRPEHAWEMSVAPVNEGPEVIRNAATGQLFIVYAADASWTQSYKMGLLAWTGGHVADPGSWHKLAKPWFTGSGHGCVVDTAAGARLVYHRKVSGDPGWADREIRWTPCPGTPTTIPSSGRPVRPRRARP